MSDESAAKLRARAMGLAVTTTLLAGVVDACTNNTEATQQAQSSGSEAADAGASTTASIETADAGTASTESANGSGGLAAGPEDAATPRQWQNPHGRG
ncbi:MAG: hypothetical protein JNK05_38375 [Myxococcales bacterium]|nr:hypothetical protein [Myxococcales bacterium]